MNKNGTDSLRGDLAGTELPQGNEIAMDPHYPFPGCLPRIGGHAMFAMVKSG